MAEDRDVTEKISHLRALLRGHVKPSSPRFDFEIEALFGGLVGIQMEPGETHVLAPGVAISATYAHCFSYFMAAFERPPAPGAPHPAPWVALRGGSAAYDIEAEVRLEPTARLAGLPRLDTIRLIASLIRLLSGMPIRMPAISNTSYDQGANSVAEPVVFALETLPSWVSGTVRIDAGFAHGLAQCLPLAASLMSDPTFERAFATFDAMFWLPTAAARLTALWSAMETAMRPGRSDITKRLARALGDYVGSDRRDRDRIVNEVIRLYGERSSSSHNAQPPSDEVVRASYLIARSMFIRIVAEGTLPSPASPT